MEAAWLTDALENGSKRARVPFPTMRFWVIL
jgi:hypothetical protein